MASTRTPEGDLNVCPICGHEFRLEPSRPPADAPCPHCGTLNWFADPVVLPPARSGGISCLGELVPLEAGEAIPLRKHKLLVGRRSSCDIVLEYSNISALHCVLELLNGFWHVRDMHSRNGIRVNGMRCESHVLLPGDEISVARHRYEVVYQPLATR